MEFVTRAGDPSNPHAFKSVVDFTFRASGLDTPQAGVKISSVQLASALPMSHHAIQSRFSQRLNQRSSSSAKLVPCNWRLFQHNRTKSASQVSVTKCPLSPTRRCHHPIIPFSPPQYSLDNISWTIKGLRQSVKVSQQRTSPVRIVDKQIPGGWPPQKRAPSKDTHLGRWEFVASLGFWAGRRVSGDIGCRPARPNQGEVMMRRIDSMPGRAALPHILGANSW